jgi:hypothetical protein
VLSIATLGPASAEQGNRNYRNARFGVSADVPSDWKAGREPDNNDGLVFSSPDGAATITVSGILNADDQPASAVVAEEQRAGDGETITYRKASARRQGLWVPARRPGRRRVCSPRDPLARAG